MKKLAVITALLAVCLIGTGAFLTRNTSADHQSLKSSALVPLIPTAAFFADPRSEHDFIPSHDGTLTISKKAGIMGTRYVVRDIASQKILAEFPSGLSGIRWHPSARKLRFIYEGDDWEADIAAPERVNWVRTSPIKLSGGWSLIDYATANTGPVRFWGRTNAREVGHIWHVSQDGLNAERIAEGNRNTLYWVFDESAEPRIRVDTLDPATRRVFVNREGGWEPLFDHDLRDDFQPASEIDAEGKMMVRSSRGRDKAALVSFDIETGEETVLVENPNGDIGFTKPLTYDGGPDIVRMGTETLEYAALTPRGETFLKILREFPAPQVLGATHRSPSGRYVTQSLSPASTSWIHLLIDLQEQSYEIISSSYFRRFKDRLVQEEAVTFPARDGLEIPAILSLPKGTEGPIPFVVEVHGGPNAATSLGFKSDTQFLNNRGYGVLSVNFRGSDGFGKSFQARGHRQYGRAMQDDVSDAARWLVAGGLADPKALAVMGTSYGGYAAAMAMTQEPDLFAAGISEFPMLDVAFQSRHYPGFWDNDLAGWTRYFGDIELDEDLEEMRQFSPVTRVADLHGPLMVFGGARDQITAVQQVREFERAAKAAGKYPVVHYFEDAGHGAHRWQDKHKRARLIEDFLAQTLGGRSGGFEVVELAYDYID